MELAKQSLDAEQKKFNLGASTSTLVLQNQSGLATAESNLVSAMAAYEKAEVELDRSTGLLIEHAGIDMGDAVKGEVSHMPENSVRGAAYRAQSAHAAAIASLESGHSDSGSLRS